MVDAHASALLESIAVRKRLALVLLQQECDAWQAGMAEPAGAATGPVLPAATHWSAAMAFTELWLQWVAGWMSWFTLPWPQGDHRGSTQDLS
jgi:hypothetical protein